MIPLGIFAQKKETVVVTSLTVIPTAGSTVSLNQGSTLQLTVYANWSDSSQTNVTNSATYHSSYEARATVSGTGLITASSVNIGGASINITYGGKSVWVNVNVEAYITSIFASPDTISSLPQGRTEQIYTYAVWSNGAQTNVTTAASYTRTNTRITVSSNGLITAVTVGSSGVTVNYGGFSDSVTISVSAAVVDSISRSPSSISLPAGRTQQITVTAHMSNGGTQDVTSSASYSSNNTSRATVSGGGLVTAGNTTGSYTITINYGGYSATISGSTTAAVIDSISVSPTSFSLPQGLTQQLAVTAHMSNGGTQNITSSASYSSNQTGRMTVNSAGLVTAGTTNGSATITVTYSGHQTTSAGTTTAAVTSSISVSPNSFGVDVGNTQQLTVTAHLSNGGTQNVTASANYTRTNTNITVSSGGLVTGSVAGSSGVNITYDGKNTSASITVNAVEKVLTSIECEPSALYMYGTADTDDFQIRGYYNDSTSAILNVVNINMAFVSGIVNNIQFVAVNSTTLRASQQGPIYNYGIGTYSATYSGSEGSPSPVNLVISVFE